MGSFHKAAQPRHTCFYKQLLYSKENHNVPTYKMLIFVILCVAQVENKVWKPFHGVQLRTISLCVRNAPTGHVQKYIHPLISPTFHILHSLTQGIADHLIPLPRQTPRSDPRGHSCPCCQHPISPVSITNHLSHIYLSINKHVNVRVFPIPTTTAFMQPPSSPLHSAPSAFHLSPFPPSGLFLLHGGISNGPGSICDLTVSLLRIPPCLVYAVWNPT